MLFLNQRRRDRVLLHLVTLVLCAASVGAQEKPATPGVQVFADPLLPDAARPAGASLKGTNLSAGPVKWVATKEVTIDAGGATSTAPGGAHHPIPEVAGIIHLQADINAQGSGFTALAVGRGDLSMNFWNNVSLLFYIQGKTRYNLSVGGKDLIAHPDPSVVQSGAPNHLDLVIDTIARTVTGQINGKSVLQAVALPETSQLSGLTAAGFRFNEPMTAPGPSISNYRIEVTRQASTGFEPVDLAMCYVVPDAAATLAWKVASPGPDAKVPYIIRDYMGQETGKGFATLGSDQKVTMTQTFPRGYYEIYFPAAGQTFGIISLEPHAGPADPFFALDTGLSWLEAKTERRPALVKVLGRSGISMVRERLGIGNINPGEGKYNWEGGARQFDSMRKVYAENNVSVLEIVDGSGGYLSDVTGQRYAKNLPKLAKVYGDLAKHWSIWGGAECDNEPDLLKMPAEQYVPMVKCLSYGLADAQSTVPVVSGVFATIPPGPYFETCAANGMLDDSDVVSFHSYDKAPAVEGMVARYRTWLKNSGKETLPLWHTECGWSWKKGPDRPPADQDEASGLEIAEKAEETMASGVARYFPFVYSFYEEGAKNFGMLGREATPLRSMADYVACVQALSNKKYLGDLQGLDASVTLARVFGDAASPECVAVLYTGEVVPGAKIFLPLKIRRAAGADGRALAIADGSVSLADGMAYIWVDRAELGDKLKTDTSMGRLYQLGQHPLGQKRLASPLILRFLADKFPARASSRRYLVTQEMARELPINVRVQNLSEMPLELTPSITLPNGKPQPAAAVTVPAMGSVDVAWKLDGSSALDFAQTQLVTVSGKAASGIQPSPLAIPIVMDGTMEQNLARHKNQLPLPIADAKWERNNSGSGQAIFSKTAEGAWRMDMKYAGHENNWSYPSFPLPVKVDPKLYSGFVMRARIMKPAGGVAIIAVPGDKTPSFWTPDIFPADGEWHVSYVPFAEFKPGPNGTGDQNSRINPAAWIKLQIGMGGGGAENALEISDLILVGGGGD